MLRLHHAPMACSLASRFALAESGLSHEIVFVRTWKDEQKTASYLKIHPRGKVPALETPEGVLTESTAILPYIAGLAPDRALMPAPGSFSYAKAQSWLSFLSSSLHVSLSAVIAPLAGADTEEALKAAKARAADVFAFLDTHLDGRPHILDEFSVCDLYLTVFSLWRGAPQLAGALPVLPNIDRLQAETLARPALGGILDEEIAARFAA